MARLPYVELVGLGTPTPPPREAGYTAKQLKQALDNTYRIVETTPLQDDRKQEVVDLLLDQFVLATADDQTAADHALHSQAVLLSALRLLKLLGRSTSSNKKMFSSPTIRALLWVAETQLVGDGRDSRDDSNSKSHGEFNSADASLSIAQEALTCVANIMLINTSVIDWFHKIDGMATLIRILESIQPTPSISFLCGRIIFLVTHRGANVTHYVEQSGLPDIIAKACTDILPIAKDEQDRGMSFAVPFNAGSALNELMKATFNLCTFYHRSCHQQDHGSLSPQAAASLATESSKSTLLPGQAQSSPKARLYDSTNTIPPSHVHHFTKLLGATIDIILTLQPRDSVPQIPSSQAFNVLLNLPIIEPTEVRDLWMPPLSDENKWRVLDHLMGVMNATAMAIEFDPKYKMIELPNDKQTTLMPLFLILTYWVCESREAHARVSATVLGDESKRDTDHPPEEWDNLCGQLVRIMRSPLPTDFTNAVSDLLFCLCNQSPKIMINRFGYGNVAGYFMRQHILIGSDDMEGLDTKFGECGGQIDPITGRAYSQRDRQHPPASSTAAADADNPFTGMTDEEKEREAERLFVLFERLNKTGVVKVNNPVVKAYQCGKMQELNDESEQSDSSNKDNGD